MELVSVIIPTHQAEWYVARALESVFSQTYPHVEIIVVDDGSTDNTVDLVRRTLEKDSPHRWEVVERPRNGGPSRARNEGLRIARGTWLQFLDSDDLLAPTKLERQMSAGLVASSDVVAVHSPWLLGSGRGQQAEWEGQLCSPSIEGQSPLMCLVPRVRPLLAAALVRRRAVEQVRGFNESLRFWECEELCLRIARVGRFEPLESNEPLYFWRMPAGQDYIGESAAKYCSTEVALAWIELILLAVGNQPIASLGLPRREVELVLDECTQRARQLYATNREAFAQYMIGVRTLHPAFRPTKPLRLMFASLFMSYERAEALAALLRDARQLLRNTLGRHLASTSVLWSLDL